MTFEDEDVARCYRHRAPYAPALHDLLIELVPSTRKALDLGCGPGKLAHELMGRFDAVDAVDPSAAMITVARETPSAVRWICAPAETAELSGPYDLVTAGASIHWMDHAAVFPKLRGCMSAGATIAFVEGDSAFAPPWQDAWNALIRRWLQRVGNPYDPSYTRGMQAHRAWVDIRGERTFEFEHAQPPETFIAKEHSRATWARCKLGALAAEMDAELSAILAPYVRDGLLRFNVQTRVMWGSPR